LLITVTCNATDEASDGARSQLSAGLDDVTDDVNDDDDDDDEASSCCSSVDNESLTSAVDVSARCRAADNATQSQRSSPHQGDAAAAAAAAAALISDQYPVETLLANVQALLKLAMDSARHREQQATIRAGRWILSS